MDDLVDRHEGRPHDGHADRVEEPAYHAVPDGHSPRGPAVPSLVARSGSPSSRTPKIEKSGANGASISSKYLGRAAGSASPAIVR